MTHSSKSQKLNTVQAKPGPMRRGGQGGSSSLSQHRATACGITAGVAMLLAAGCEQQAADGREQMAQRKRQRQHPLANRLARQDLVRHPSPQSPVVAGGERGPVRADSRSWPVLIG